MSHIRTIKPQFFTSEDVVELSLGARLLYIATWCEADRSRRAFRLEAEDFQDALFPCRRPRHVGARGRTGRSWADGAVWRWSCLHPDLCEASAYQSARVRVDSSRSSSRVNHAGITRERRVNYA